MLHVFLLRNSSTISVFETIELSDYSVYLVLICAQQITLFSELKHFTVCWLYAVTQVTLEDLQDTGIIGGLYFVFVGEPDRLASLP